MKKSTPQRSKKAPGPPKEFEVQIALRFTAEQLDAIGAVLAGKETRASFIRLAIERELERRHSPGK